MKRKQTKRKDKAYDKFTDAINSAAQVQSLSSLIEVPSLDVAQKISEHIIDAMRITRAERLNLSRDKGSLEETQTEVSNLSRSTQW